MVAQFNWIVEGLLAGSARPGLMNPLEEDLEFLEQAGIRLVVSLTEEPSDLPRGPWEQMHFPVDDMGSPTPRAAHRMCQRVLESMGRFEPVLLHCKAGLGRTGTMLACCLVARGWSAEEATRELRRLNRNYIQSEHQERFIQHYADFVASPARSPREPVNGSAGRRH